jgi:hypothetical protein
MKNSDRLNRSPMRAESARAVIMARLLILQSKRLMLNSLLRRLEQSGHDGLEERVACLRADTARAQHAYRSIVLAYGSAESRDYWLVAYNRLIEVGNVVVTRLREATVELPATERYQVSVDVEMLELMVDQWTESMRKSMASAVA